MKECTVLSFCEAYEKKEQEYQKYLDDIEREEAYVVEVNAIAEIATAHPRIAMHFREIFARKKENDFIKSLFSFFITHGKLTFKQEKALENHYLATVELVKTVEALMDIKDNKIKEKILPAGCRDEF